MFPWIEKGKPPPNKGKRMPEEQRTKLCAAKRKLVEDGWTPWNKGKKMNYSEAHRRQLADNLRKSFEKNRKYRLGDKFPDKRHGYVWVCAPGHPNANNAGYVHEHRLIAQKAMGRPLKRSETVHHINGDKADNRNKNLLVCNHGYHRWLHNRMSYLFARLWFAEGRL